MKIKYLIAITHTRPHGVTLRSRETAPANTLANASAAKLKLATRADVPDKLLDRTYENLLAARAAVVALTGQRGLVVVTSQALTRVARRVFKHG